MCSNSCKVQFKPFQRKVFYRTKHAVYYSESSQLVTIPFVNLLLSVLQNTNKEVESKFNGTQISERSEKSHNRIVFIIDQFPPFEVCWDVVLGRPSVNHNMVDGLTGFKNRFQLFSSFVNIMLFRF